MDIKKIQLNAHLYKGEIMSIIKPCIETKNLDDLHPAEYNPREIGEKAFYGLGQSLEKFGLMSYIVWNRKTGNIVGGHQRYKQLRDHNVKETEVIVVDLDDTEEMALNIALNSRSIQGDFTIGAIEALRVTEARIGQAFNDIKLDELLEELEKKNKKKEKKGKKDDGYMDADPINMEYTQAVSLIICPECGSKWNMETNEVVENNYTGEEEAPIIPEEKVEEEIKDEKF